MTITKMQGLGNDYLYYYGEVPDPSSLSRRLSDRHRGVGADGLILITPSDVADFRMRIFNADGSEAAMCGNGIRCAGKYVYDHGYTQNRHLTFETRAGIRSLFLEFCDNRVIGASVCMGQAILSEEILIREGSHCWSVVPVNVGVPHAVLFLESTDTLSPEYDGPLIGRHPDFPEGTNVDFVRVLDRKTLRMRVWERGSGVTMACGTGACAAVAVAVHRNLCPSDTAIRVCLDGGSLDITVSGKGMITMRGPSVTICECEVPCDDTEYQL